MTDSRRTPARPRREIDPDEAKERAMIQELFRGVIKARCQEGGIPAPRRLPRLDALELAAREEDRTWFPVPGMYGGFNYCLERRGDHLQLITESWCRVVDGSGMRHVVTAKQAVLVDEGFV